MSLSTSRALVVSIHDVSPLTWKTTVAMLDDLRPLGVTTFSLLVVPDHHHRGHFLENPDFCTWLRERAVSSDEIVIHGYYHQRERRPGEKVAQKLITRFYTQDEGEFYDLDEESAFAAVSKAQAEFRQIGLKPSGFIAPAWLLSNPAECALRRAGIEYTTRIGHVANLRTGTIHPSQSMVYSVRNTWRRLASLAWNAHLFRRLRGNPLLRVGLHPPDFNQPAVWRQIRRSISLALEDRVPLTYEQWLRTHGQG
jgi:predicted deacetylase